MGTGRLVIGDVVDILLHQADSWLPQLRQHMLLSAVALAISIAVGVPVGALLTRIERVAFAVISIANLGRTIPSLAVLALVYPWVGTGFVPAVVALVAMGIPPILLTTYTGVREVDEHARDAAVGMGLTSVQRLARVELPIAAPLVISGVRTAGVQVVASATLAALIGGGGLGEMILAGLTNLRFDMLVAGSVLVALLAVLTEACFSLLERRGLPRGIRALQEDASASAGGYQAGAAVSRARWLVIAGAACVAGAALVFGSGLAVGFVDGSRARAANQGPLPTITIGSKDFTEQLVLGELYAQALEAQGYPVERKLNLGATAVADAALQREAIDVYPEYTGTALFAVLKQRDVLGADVYRQVAEGYDERGMTVLAQTPFSNGNAIVMRASRAEELGVRTLSDLAGVADELRFGAVPGFDTRADGLPLLEERYGMRFGEVKTFEIGLKYKALMDGRIDVVYGFETDGQIAEHDLLVLRDDRGVWPPYHAAPVVSSAFMERAGPAFAPTMNAVTELLDAPTMRRLNNEVDGRKREPAEVAAEFLAEHGLLEAGARPTITIGSKDFTEQLVLGELYAQALEARGFPVQRRLNLGATAVADSALRSGQIDLYPEYTGTSLSAVLKQVPDPGTTAQQAYAAAAAGYDGRGMGLLAQSPFSNGNAIVTTRQVAERHGLRTLSDLARVADELRFGAVPGFDTREDGLPLLRSQYGIEFADVRSYENGLKYKALTDGKIDVVYGFETDGQIARDGLVVLRDDRRVWPPYHVAPVVREQTLEATGADFDATVNAVTRLLDTETMQRLNSQVDDERREPGEVAAEFLAEHHLA